MFLILKIPFFEWTPLLKKNSKLTIINSWDIDKYPNDIILPICIDDYKQYNSYTNNIFKNVMSFIFILNNKSSFGHFMLSNFPTNIPTTYYYNFDTEIYIHPSIPTNKKMIKKPNDNYGGKGIEIINSFSTSLKEHIVQEYIEHKEYYCGHFLVLNGVIISKIYFKSSHKFDNGIKLGNMINYNVIEKLDINDDIFSNIFLKLNYSGFANSDFIISNKNIIIFEINPRPGGSLIFNEKYFNLFLDKLSNNINK